MCTAYPPSAIVSLIVKRSRLLLIARRSGAMVAEPLRWSALHMQRPITRYKCVAHGFQTEIGASPTAGKLLDPIAIASELDPHIPIVLLVTAH